MSCILSINSSAIKDNVKFLSNIIHNRNGYLFGVTKVLSGLPELANIFIENGCDGIADSRWQNLKRIRESKILNNKIIKEKNIKFLNLRLPSISEIENIIKYSDISLVSEIATIKAMDIESKKQKKRYQYILMIDLGDLREGIIPKDARQLNLERWQQEIKPILNEVKNFQNTELIGIGTNLACYGGITPSDENMNLLVNLYEWIKSEFNFNLNYLSGSNSSGLPYLLSGKMPEKVNHFRIGESMILGLNVLNRNPIEGLRQDTVKLSIEVIEKKYKPSKPIGKSAQNAFGELVEFEDKGTMLRLIGAAGRQDLLIDGLTPIDNDIKILGASSDHIELELLNNYDKYDIGSFIDFKLSYGSLLAASTSSYVDIKII